MKKYFPLFIVVLAALGALAFFINHTLKKDKHMKETVYQFSVKADPDYAKKPDIKWNFTKFLIGKDGRVTKRFEPTAPLEEVEKAVKEEISKEK